jgi:hypothetical protein
MVKSRGLSWIALKNKNILAVKVQYSHCSKFDNFRPAYVRLCKNNISSLKHKKKVGENVVLIINQEKMARSDNWLHSYEP